MFIFKSLRTRLIFHFLAVTLLSVITIVIILSLIRAENIKQKEFDRLALERDLKLEHINSWVDERVGDIEVLADNENIIAISEKSQLKTENIETVRKIFQNLVNYYNFYAEVFYISADSGNIVISTCPECEKANRNMNLFLSKVVSSQQRVSVDTYVSPHHNQRNEVAFSIPIMSTQNGQPKIDGVLVVVADLQKVLKPLLKAQPGMGTSGETLIVDNQSRVLNKLKWVDNEPFKMKINAEPARLAAGGNTGIIQSVDYRGKKVMAAFSYIPALNWGLVIKRDYREIYAPIWKMWLQTIALLAIIFPVVVLISIMVGRTIAKPIQKINKTVKDFDHGKFGVRCDVVGKDEVASLAESFNTMAQTLETQIAIRNGVADISQTIIKTVNVDEFAEKVLRGLLELSDCQIGAFYLLDEISERFNHIESVGLAEDSARSFCCNDYEGELGKALATKTISIVRDISADSMFTFKTTVGDIIPKEIMTIPIVVANKIEAIISIASISSFSDVFQNIVENLHLTLDSAFAKRLADAKTAKLNEELTFKNTELQNQATELEQQTVELEEQSEELKIQQLHVEQANKLKSEFLSNMSHELRTPLNSVLSLSQLMLADDLQDQNPQEIKERIEIIERNGKRLLKLINDILDLSKIESGKMDIYASSFTINELIDPIVSSMKPIGMEKGIELNVDIEKNIDVLNNDKDKLQQVLINLISNALKFTHEGQVGIRVTQVGQYVVFNVWDSGIGIPQYALKSVFDEFKQVDGSTTRQYGGTGLGLAICKKITTLLGGRISVESEVDVGTTFTLTIPLKIEHKEYIQYNDNIKPQGVKKSIPDGKIPRILVVEDDRISRDQIKRLLSDSGFHVDVAENGEEGLKMVQKNTPDAMILDLMMPKVDGFKVVEVVRSVPKTKSLPVLVLTAKDISAGERATLSYNNVHQLIQKGSLDREQLVEAVYELIGWNKNYVISDEVDKSAESEIEPEKIKSEPGEKISILVVDDYEDNLVTTIALVKTVLKDLNVEISEARDGLEAVQAAKEIKPHLILMDIQMPNMGGTEATSIIKNIPELENTIVIALTASAMLGDREAIMDAGCDDYISKPVEPRRLNAILRKWIGGNNE